MSLDMSNEGFDRDIMEGAGGHTSDDPWLARRRLTLGASDVYTAMVALGWRAPEGVPGWVLHNAKTLGPWNEPRLFLTKAGLRPETILKGPPLVGLEREEEILGAWDGHPDVSDIGMARDVPRSWLPLVDRYCPDLSCTPDAWGYDPLGRLVVIQVKASVAPGYVDPRPWYAVQCQAEMAVQGADWAVMPTAWGWAASWAADGPITHEVYERDDALVGEIRECARETMARVRALRAALHSEEDGDE